MYGFLSLILLVLVYAHGRSEWALGDPVWTSVIISGYLVMGRLTAVLTVIKGHSERIRCAS